MSYADRLLSHLSLIFSCQIFSLQIVNFIPCETALLRIQNDIFFSLNAGCSTEMLLLDLSAAFDTTDHSILFNRLENWFGVSTTALNLLSSFLSGRFQVVVTSDVKSQRNLLEYGISQGNVF